MIVSLTAFTKAYKVRRAYPCFVRADVSGVDCILGMQSQRMGSALYRFHDGTENWGKPGDWNSLEEVGGAGH